MNKKLKLLLFAILILSLCIATVSLSACEENKLTVSYDSNHTVYEWDTLDSLKPYLTVTYKDKDGNINTVTDYVLSGTLTKGKCKVTVTYNDSTAWFICNVSAIDFDSLLTFELSDDTDTYIVTGINGNETAIAIPPSYNGKPVTEIGMAAFYKTNITSLIIPDSVISIGYSAFNTCISLTNITTPDSVTSIGDYAFLGCSDLTSITIGNSVTNIGNSALAECNSLTSITIGKSITSIENMAFYNCRSLANINYLGTIDDWCKIEGLNYLMRYGTSNKTLVIDGKEITGDFVIPNTITAISSAAFYGTSITSITIPDSVTDIGQSVFSSCSNLTNITIPDSVTNIGDSAFSNCTSLTNITLPDSVTSINEYAFYGCHSLTRIIFPDSVTSIDEHAFSFCSSLTSIILPDSITEIGDSAFSGCSNLESIIIPDSVIRIGDHAFSSCFSLTSIILPDSVTDIGDYAFNDCSNIKSITIGNSATSISMYAFCGCSSLTSVTIPDSVTSICMGAFIDCSKLANINYLGTIDDWFKIEGLNYLMQHGTRNKTFSLNGQAVTELVIPNTVTSIQYSAFYGTNITSVTFEENSQCTRIGEDAFCGCSSLTSVTIGNNVTSIGSYVFYGCNSLANINYLGTIDDWFKIKGLNYLMQYGSTNKTFSLNGQAVTELVIPNTVTSIPYSAFYGTNITSITFEENSQCTRIGSYAFYGCSSLANINYLGTIEDWCKIEGLDNLMYYGTSSKTLVIDGKEITGDFLIPNTVTTISSGAFYGTSITSITIPDSVTSIGSGAFSYCSSLTSVTIPDSVTSIDQQAFQGCINLTNINFNGTITQWKKIAKFSNWNDNVPATKVICTDGVVEL